jgi:hypothetical protein
MRWFKGLGIHFRCMRRFKGVGILMRKLVIGVAGGVVRGVA